MEKPNIVLLTIDSLRADVLGCNGNPLNITPAIDRVAAEGTVFKQTITGGSWTQAAFPVLMTSTYASMFGGCLGPLSPDRPRLVGSLADHGYTTAGFTTSPLLSEAYGYNLDFDNFINLDPADREPWLRKVKGGQYLLRKPITHSVLGLFNQRLRPAQLYASAKEISLAAQDWVEQASGPFFLWVHYMDVHWPYHLHDSLDEPTEISRAWRDLAHFHEINQAQVKLSQSDKERYIQLYQTAVEYTDQEIGKFLSRLNTLGKLENTIVILTSDHGEEFYERSHWGHVEINLYDEILKVPLIVRLPDQVDPLEVDEQVGTIDVMPTILDLAGCPAPENIAGKSLVTLLQQSNPKFDDSIVISERWRDTSHIIAVRTTNHKYIWNSNQPSNPEFYDLQADPHEKNNLKDQHLELTQKYFSIVKNHLETVALSNPDSPVPPPEVDDAVITRLRDLGYVD